MTKPLTAARMRALENGAIRSGAVTGLALMERAGQGVFDAIMAEWPALAAGPHTAVVICGPGNNGGDGFVVARLLREAGWAVDVHFIGSADRLPPDAKANYLRWTAEDPVDCWDGPLTSASLSFREYDLVVDALFGIGLTRPIVGYWRENIDKIVHDPPDIYSVAIDIPSGFDADTGRIVDHTPEELEKTMSYVDAQRIGQFGLTVTFHRLKCAHLVPDCARHCGRIVVVDIGL